MKRRHRPKNYNRKNSNHHIVPKSIGGTNNPDNIDRIPKTQHRAIHTLFANLDTLGKIERILELDNSTLQGDFSRDVKQVLNLYKGLIYHSHCKK